MVFCNIFRSNQGLCGVLTALRRRRDVIELFSYHQKPARELLSIRAIVTDEKCLVALSYDKSGDVHGVDDVEALRMMYRCSIVGG